MKIIVAVKPKSHHEKVEVLPDGTYRVSVTAPPADAAANEAVIAALSKFFKVPRSSIEIVRGETARKKQVVIHE